MDISNVYGNIPKIHFAIELIQTVSSSALDLPTWIILYIINRYNTRQIDNANPQSLA